MKPAEDALRLDEDIPQVQFALGVLISHRGATTMLSRQPAAPSRSTRTARMAARYSRRSARTAATSTRASPRCVVQNRFTRAFRISYLWIEGDLLFLQGRYTEALPLIEKAVVRNPAF